MVAEKPFVYDLHVIHEGYALLPELVCMHVAPVPTLDSIIC